jgi:hypothetical protein
MFFLRIYAEMPACTVLMAKGSLSSSVSTITGTLGLASPPTW